MKTRVITGAIMALVFIPIFIIGGIPLGIILGILSMVAIYEMLTVQKNDETGMNWYLLITEEVIGIGVFVAFGMYLIGDIHGGFVLGSLTIALFMAVVYAYFLKENWKVFLLNTLYAPLGFVALLAMRYQSLPLIGYIFLITTSTDIFAYFVGVKYGKHRLAPKISPKKSIEGSIGGIVFAVLFTTIYVLFFDINQILSINVNLLGLILLIVLISSLGQIGDLVASKIKRVNGVKDFSNIFPGHGGVVDRFDSVLLVGLTLLLISLGIDLI